MLSILIAVYNIDVRELAGTLAAQCRAAKIPFEILIFDDHSDQNFQQINEPLTAIENVRYHRFAANLGRAKLRNALGQAAKYPYLLFMDGDSKVVDENYIQNYLGLLAEGLVLVGKTSYAIAPPDTSCYLRWHYGIHREAIPAAVRNINPYHSFRTHHFIIPKNIFQQVSFNENISRYGHEDTFFGLELQAADIEVLHLDNPLEHTGLDATQVFLEKSRTAVENLYQLSSRHVEIKSKLLEKHRLLKRWGIADWLGRQYLKMRHLLERQLCGRHPKLWIFDIYKLAYLCHIAGRSER